MREKKSCFCCCCYCYFHFHITVRKGRVLFHLTIYMYLSIQLSLSLVTIFVWQQQHVISSRHASKKMDLKIANYGPPSLLLTYICRNGHTGYNHYYYTTKHPYFYPPKTKIPYMAGLSNLQQQQQQQQPPSSNFPSSSLCCF